MLDIKTLTLGEIAALEKMSGLSIDHMEAEDSPKGDLMAAMAVLIKKRNGDPTFTFKQAKALTMLEVREIFALVKNGDDDDAGDDGDGDAGAGKAPATTSSKRGRTTSRRSSSTSGSRPRSTGS